jgi:hypothetical protein
LVAESAVWKNEDKVRDKEKEGSEMEAVQLIPGWHQSAENNPVKYSQRRICATQAAELSQKTRGESQDWKINMRS